MSKANSFRTKLWSYFVLFTVVIFSLLWILQTVFLQSFYNRMLAKNTRQAAQEIAAEYGNEDFSEEIDRISSENSLLVFVTDPEGIILYSSDSYKSYYHSEEHPEGGGSNPYHKGETLSWQTANYRNLPDGYEDFLTALAQSGSGEIEYTTDSKFICGSRIDGADGQQSVLYVSAALGAVGAAASIIRIQLLWVTGLSLLIAFGLAWFLARKFAVPVDQLSMQAKMLAGESYEPVFEKGFCRELDELSDSLDQTAEKLSEARAYQKELLANVSHDLRTPLTMIRGYAEMVRDVSWEDEEQRKADAAIIIREADRLTALVNEILEYSRLQDHDAMRTSFSETDLGALAGQVCDQFAPLAERGGIVIERSLEEGCVISGDPKLLERAAYNLIDNAIRHTGDSGRITVTVRKEDGVLFEVQDYGPGIPEPELPHIWEKYYTSRQRRGKGVSGLGLAIVKQVAEIHGASCGAESRPDRGSSFRMVFRQ